MYEINVIFVAVEQPRENHQSGTNLVQVQHLALGQRDIMHTELEVFLDSSGKEPNCIENLVRLTI